MGVYATLELRLRARGEGAYLADLSFQADDAIAMAEFATDVLVQLDPAALRPRLDDSETYGRALSEAVFGHRAMRAGWERAVAYSAGAGLELRVLLRLDARDERLQELPWELLRTPDGERPIAQHYLLQRYLSSADLTPMRTPDREGLRALVVVCSPADLAQYAIAPVDTAAAVAWAGLAPIRSFRTTLLVSHEQPVTQERLSAALRAGCDVLYLVAPVTLADGKPYLWLQGPDGRGDRIAFDLLARVLAGLSQRPLLTYLASYGTGDQTQMTARAVAPLFAASGLPAVLTYEGPISAATAQRFNRALFQELARDGDIARACQAARQAVRHQPDWWAPVLYSRLAQGSLWQNEGADLARALRTTLPVELRDQADLLADLLASAKDRAGDPGAVRAVETAPELIPTLRALEGRTMRTDDRIVSFGAGNQFGNVTIADVAGRDLVRIDLDVPGETETKRISGADLTRCDQLEAAFRKLYADGYLHDSVHARASELLGVVPDEWQSLGWSLTSLPDGRQLKPGAQRGPVTVFDLFRRALLIQGPPGMGRRRALGALAHALLVQRKADERRPAPALFSLTDWRPTDEPLEGWLAAEGLRVYGLAAADFRALLERGRVVALLDDLERLADQRRADCIAAIGAFRRAFPQVGLVVVDGSPRPEERQALSLLGALELEPLSPRQIGTRLEAGGEQLAGLRQGFVKSAVWGELLAAPVLLDLAILTYHGQEQLPAAPSVAVLRGAVIDDYRARSLRELDPALGAPDQARTVLAQLANHLERDGREHCFLEDLGQDMLTEQERMRFLLDIAVRATITAAIVCSTVFFLSPALYVIVVLAFGLWQGLRAALVQPILFQRLERSGQPRLSSLYIRLFFTWAAISLVIILGAYLKAPVSSWVEMPGAVQAAAVAGGSSIFFAAVTLAGLVGLGGPAGSLVERNGLRQSMRRTRGEAISPTVGAALLGGMWFSFAGFSHLFPLVPLAIFYIYGGEATLYHGALQRSLKRRKGAPADLEVALDRLAQAGLLQKVGAGYKFPHMLIQERYAARVEPAPLPAQASLWDVLAGPPSGEAQPTRGGSPTPVQPIPVGVSQTAAGQLQVVTELPPPLTADIGEQLGHVDLALAMAAGYCRDHDADAEEYLDRLNVAPAFNGSPLRVQSLSAYELGARETRLVEAVVTALSVTLDGLDASEADDRLLGRLIVCMAWLSSDDVVSVALAQRLLTLTSGAALGVARESDGGAPDERALARAFQRIDELGFVIRDERGCSLHPLIAELLRSLPGSIVAQGAVERGVLALADGAAPAISRIHLRAVADRALERSDEVAAALGDTLAYRLLGKERGDHGLEYARRATAIRVALHGEQHQDTARSQQTMGRWLRRVGELAAARAALERARATRERLLGPTHPATGETLYELGLVLYDSGDYGQALSLFEQARAISADAGGARVGLAEVIGGLASARWRRHELPEAEAGLREALAMLDEAGEGNGLAAAQLRERLALVLHDREALDEAAAMIERAQKELEGLLESDAPQLIATQFYKGLLDLDRGALPLAEAAFTTGRARLDDLAAAQSGGPTLPAILANLGAAIEAMSEAAGTSSRLARSAAFGRAAEQLNEVGHGLASTPPRFQLALRPILDRVRDRLSRTAGRAGRIAITAPVTSPYLYSKPVSGEYLIGREDVFNRIRLRWVRKEARDSLLIHGHRRMGKTSIAQAIANEVPMGAQTATIYLTLESVDLSDEGSFYYGLASAIQQHEQLEQLLPEPLPEEFAGRQARVGLNRFLAHLDRARDEATIVLIIDEFEFLFESLGGRAATAVLANLRGQTQSYPWLALAIVGLSNLKDLSLSYKAAVHGWAEIQVGFLRRADVAQVLANPSFAEDFPLDYEPEAIATIAEATSGQPYLVQVIGTHLVERYNDDCFTTGKSRSQRFSAADVLAVLSDPQFYATASAYFGGVWRQVQSGLAGERELCALLAHEPDGLAEPALAAASGLPADDLREALASLERHAILVCALDGRWHYAVPLMRRWVEETRPYADEALADQR